MKIDNLVLNNNIWQYESQGLDDRDTADIVFIFGDTDIIKAKSTYKLIKEKFPNSHLIGSSSSGNILGSEISKFPVVATAVKFESSKVEVQSAEYHEGESLQDLSKELVNKLSKDGLKHIFLLSDGLKVNGSNIVEGINSALLNVEVTGGLAGDGERFQETYIISDDEPKASIVSVVGFYGDNLVISSGCFGGWSEFGTKRVITKSKANILYEIDNEPALDFYKRYLGDYAKDLPNSGLRFPLSIRKDDNDSEVIRTLLGIDEENKSIIFAGDVPEGYYAKLMKPDTDVLIEGAGHAAKEIIIANDKPALGLVVSCVGRKLVLGQLIDEELQEVAETLGTNISLIGFYSYGEIAPFEVNKLQCNLHNQTMTLTAIYEN
jgi:hypothetical protein